jgi:hypothetical protein
MRFALSIPQLDIGTFDAIWRRVWNPATLTSSLRFAGR